MLKKREVRYAVSCMHLYLERKYVLRGLMVTEETLCHGDHIALY